MAPRLASGKAGLQVADDGIDRVSADDERASPRGAEGEEECQAQTDDDGKADDEERGPDAAAEAERAGVGDQRHPPATSVTT